ncbi:hypothetical protein PR048_002248 [Dryococelus australis]|uniref:Uncharacterized protein n=1 Tax=Dryococelus australis TaxID=614101 RepID=A0ABQ9IKD5_9NEOP|nr:hypothetical protein PR048_002248 [Dryococelus australis]
MSVHAASEPPTLYRSATPNCTIPPTPFIQYYNYQPAPNPPPNPLTTRDIANPVKLQTLSYQANTAQFPHNIANKPHYNRVPDPTPPSRPFHGTQNSHYQSKTFPSGAVTQSADASPNSSEAYLQRLSQAQCFPPRANQDTVATPSAPHTPECNIATSQRFPTAQPAFNSPHSLTSDTCALCLYVGNKNRQCLLFPNQNLAFSTDVGDRFRQFKNTFQLTLCTISVTHSIPTPTVVRADCFRNKDAGGCNDECLLGDMVTEARASEIKMDLDTDKLIATCPYRISPKVHDLLLQIKYMVHAGIMQEADSLYSAPGLDISKKSGTFDF